VTQGTTAKKAVRHVDDGICQHPLSRPPREYMTNTPTNIIEKQDSPSDSPPVLTTRKATYLVSSPQSTHIWFELLHGGDQGVRVSIPKYSRNHSADIAETLQSLDEGTVVTAVLASDTQNPPQWYLRSLHVKP